MSKRSSLPVGPIAVGLALICLGIAARFTWADVPNFKPVASIALFAGFFYARYASAAVVPIAVLAISDMWLGGYQPMLKIAVYGTLIAPIFLRGIAGSAMQRLAQGRPLVGALTLAGCATGSSVLFFAVTNFATWLVTPWYPRTGAGLVDCYLAGLPFLKYTLAGDLAFTGLLFGSYALVHGWQKADLPQMATPGTLLRGQNPVETAF